MPICHCLRGQSVCNVTRNHRSCSPCLTDWWWIAWCVSHNRPRRLLLKCMVWLIATAPPAPRRERIYNTFWIMWKEDVEEMANSTSTTLSPAQRRYPIPERLPPRRFIVHRIPSKFIESSYWSTSPLILMPIGMAHACSFSSSTLLPFISIIRYLESTKQTIVETFISKQLWDLDFHGKVFLSWPEMLF